MHKIKLILVFLFASIGVFGQSLGVIDADTAKLPPQNGLSRLSFVGTKLYYRKYTGAKKEIITTNSTYSDPSWLTLSISKTTGLQSALDLKAPLASPTFTGTVSGITKSMVGLGNVDNTADTSKPVSTSQQTALNLKADIASPTFTGTVSGITKSMVGLSNVDNTSDANKPVSSAGQTALNLKSNIANPTFTGVVTIPTPFTLGVISVTATGTQLNYLGSATGTTGTTSSNLVFSTSPTLVTPNLGTPSSVVLTNGTGLPISTGVSGLGTGISTFLATPSSANLASAVTNETGTGSLVFGTNPIITPVLPKQVTPTTPSSGVAISNIEGTGIASKDSLGVTRGLLASISSISDLQGYNGSLAQFDGSVWEKKSGSITSNGGSYAGTLIRVSSSIYWERKYDYITPEMFGAVGDSTTNDYTALQAALDADGDVFLRQVYKTNSTLTLSKSKKIFGYKTSRIYGNLTRVLTIGNVNDIVIDGINFESANVSDYLGGSETNSIANSWIIGYQATVGIINKNINIKNCSFKSTSGSINGIKFIVDQYTSGGSINGLNIENCIFQNIGRMGIEIFSGSHITPYRNVKIEMCRFENLGQKSVYGMAVSFGGHGIGNYVKNCTIINAKDVGLENVSCEYTNFENNTFLNLAASTLPYTVQSTDDGIFRVGNSAINNKMLDSCSTGSQISYQDNFTSYGNTIINYFAGTYITSVKNSSFKNDYFRCFGTTTSGKPIVIQGNSVNNVFDNCYFSTKGGTIYQEILYITSGSNNNSFTNCNWERGISATGVNVLDAGTDNKILNPYFSTTGIRNVFSKIYSETAQLLKIGNYNFWIDASENFRLKSSLPSSESDGYIVLNSNNYNTYSPTLSGTGATGTWGIGISGNAATVTNGVYANTAQNITGVKTFNPSVSTSSGIGRGMLISPTITATVDYDLSVGLDVAPTFTNGSFGNIRNIGIRSKGNIVPLTTNTYDLGYSFLKFNNAYVNYINSDGSVGIKANNTEILTITTSGVGINTTSPNSSAILDLTSTNKGLLLPRMTSTQASAISSPADGLIVYVTDTNGTFTSIGFWGRVSSTWQKLNN